ncbi:MAG: protein kinase [Gemmatimonadetes bacterium]|nr:protein kinase [Gemmatimonadota bacterium]
MATPTTEEVELATGGRYRVESLLATGGMGAVYRAYNRQLESPVAIKVLHPEIAQHEVILARFKREASLSARLSHPNIVPVFEFAAKEELAYLVMPFIEGNTLADHLLENGAMAHRDVLKMLKEVGSALSFAHRHDIVHRDVKPSNILLERETGRWLVTDFGIASVKSDEEQLTKTGATIGTPAYMAPEQFGGSRKVDARADLYSLAAVAFEALTGVLPDTLEQHDLVAQRLRDQVKGLAASQAQALTAPLAQLPDERPASVSSWLGMLDQEKGPSERWLKKVAVSLSALAVLVVGYLISKPGRESALAPLTVAILPATISGTAPNVDLSSVIPHTLEWLLLRLPGYRVVGAQVVGDREESRFGNETQPRSARLSLARELGATQVIQTWVNAAGGGISLRILLLDAANGNELASAEASGPLDSLDAVVSGVVVEAFATRVATERSGVAPVLPHGLDAIIAYFAGDAAFRKADYSAAVDHFETVIELDSTYPLAHFKRMLSLVQLSRPTAAGTQVRTALSATVSHKERLDVAHRTLLEGYEVLLSQGDLTRAERMFRQVASRTPDLVDGWFILGFIQYKFGSLLGIPLQQPRAAFHEVIRRDPEYAAAHGQLALIAIEQDDKEAALSHIEHYLEIDSVSIWASLARSVDSLLYSSTRAPLVTGSFPRRPPEYLEMIALSGGQLSPPGGARAIGVSAARALLQQAPTQQERDVAFRILMAYDLGSGRPDAAADLLRGASADGISEREIDRWTLVGTLLGHTLVDSSAGVAMAAERLSRSPAQSDNETIESLWLAARWYHSAGDPRLERVRRAIDDLSGEPQSNSPSANAFLGDLEALDLLFQGDSMAALTRWKTASTFYDAERLFFGHVASLWPLRLSRIRLAAALALNQEVIDVSDTFVRMAGFVDQVAWSEAILYRARAAAALRRIDLAVETYRALLRVLNNPDGSGLQTKEIAEAELAALDAL